MTASQKSEFQISRHQNQQVYLQKIIVFDYKLEQQAEEECFFCEKVFLTMRYWNEKWQNRDKQ